MDRGAWWATVLGTSKSWTRLSDYAFNRLRSKKNLLANAGDVGLVPELGRSPGEGNGNPLQDSCLGNLMDTGAWQLQSMGSQRVGLFYYSHSRGCEVICHDFICIFPDD